MLNYLIQTLLISGIFIALYKTVIIKSNWFVFNRIYLILTPIIALLVPLITFKETVYVQMNGIAAQTQNFVTPISEEQSTNYLLISLSAIYFSALIVFLFRFSRNLIGIQKTLRKHRKIKQAGFNYILMDGEEGSHTFLNNIFLSKKDFENNSIDGHILSHERAHAEQLHSLDLIFIEILTSVFWFNPSFWILRNSIKLNHEFLADSAVLKQGATLEKYSISLLESSVRNKALIPIANHYNHQQLKKRIKSMNMKTTSSQKRFNLLLLMLLFGISIWAFSSTEKEYIYTEQTLIQEGASAEEIKEYNSLAKKLTSDNPGELIIKMKDIDRLNFIYEKMTVEQRSSAVALPKLPPTPPPPATPRPGVSQKEMDEYNAIVSKYQNMADPYSPIIQKEDGDRIREIRNKMSDKQKDGALKLPPPPPYRQGASAVEMTEYRNITKKILNEGSNVYIKEDVDRMMEIRNKMTSKQKNSSMPPPPPPPAQQKPTNSSNTLQKGLGESIKQNENYPKVIVDKRGETIEVTAKKNSPIVYVDGVLTKDYDLDKISPDQIESVTVLKNKSAIEKYGSKGKNGAILITTKVK
jgi:TonB-dependent SusC/RagA subfamily outer membrane receptor